MQRIAGGIGELRAIDNLSAKHTAVHRLHPLTKLLNALVFVIFVASFGRYDFVRLAPYLFYPFVFIALAELPYRLLLSRVLIALPFCLFAGLSNVFFDREIAVTIANIGVSYGVISLFTILLKMYLTVMAALLLVATTPFVELTAQLRRLRVPLTFVLTFEMTYRYVGVLLEETHRMTLAYSLRRGTGKPLEMRHMGSFVGYVLLRGFDRAERVHTAMRLRGYSLSAPVAPRRTIGAADIVVLAAVVIPTVALRFVTL
jgi:cobalt/nickel transport system permease protein